MSRDALADMLESIEYFISRLGMYTEMSHSMPAVDEVVVKLIMELISALALVSRKLRKRRSREPFHPQCVTLLSATQSNG